MMFQKTCKKHYKDSSKNISFPILRKNKSNALRRFRHALNKYYVQRGLSPLNRFGYIMSNEWDTFVQQHTTPETIALSNKMKEMDAKNKFRHKLGPGGYRAAMPKWTKKKQEFREAGIPDPLEGCTVHTRNWIRGHSHTDDSRRLITSSSEVTNVAEKAKTLTTKEKNGEFKFSKRETNSAQPSRMRNIVVAHEQYLQLHRGRKGLWMKVICTRSVKHMR
jgi:hypothetical protein